MIFDGHTHLFGPGHVGGSFLSDAKKAWGDGYELQTTPEDHWNVYRHADGAIVLAFNCPQTGVVVPNEYVAAYVEGHRGRLFGFASVDPHAPDAPAQLEFAVREYGLVGLKLAPIYQNFYPGDRAYFPLYAKADELGIPILWHQGTSFVSQGFLDASRPELLDPIARTFPSLKMIVAHLGHPWHAECVSLIRKNPNVYADLSALVPRPWQFYNAMMNVTEYRVAHKVLFGSDFPFFTPQQTIDGARAINGILEGTKLPRVPEEEIEAILRRDTVGLLGLAELAARRGQA
ncbi:amidohydrolase family protein [Paenibacillus glycinis]|uniref:Amidohydrolase family protein n=1 Tax=Paenibacillus glycinis TaxID=2697035 RepID=A0ABW9XXF4_9BACL|nr:amidohydrolase family protein [Paenibacillus glycinis]NBD27108.1 amidohydrolase family protein [Paenibacillus glycinis]